MLKGRGDERGRNDFQKSRERKDVGGAPSIPLVARSNGGVEWSLQSRDYLTTIPQETGLTLAEKPLDADSTQPMKRPSLITVTCPVHQKTFKSFSRVAALLYWVDHIDGGNAVEIVLMRVDGMKERPRTSIHMIWRLTTSNRRGRPSLAKFYCLLMWL
jgi:hypothetical protein